MFVGGTTLAQRRLSVYDMVMGAVSRSWYTPLLFLPYHSSDSTSVSDALTNLRDSCGHEAVHAPSADAAPKLPHSKMKAKGAGPLGSQAHGVEALPHASILLIS